MEPDLTVLASLRKAVEAMPDDVPLRVHLAALLLRAGQRDEAIRHVGAVLQRDPGNAEALALLQPSGPAAGPDEGPGAAAGQKDGPGAQEGKDAGKDKPASGQPPGSPGREGRRGGGPEGRPAAEFDWTKAESELRDVLPPMFVGGDDTGSEPPSGRFL